MNRSTLSRWRARIALATLLPTLAYAQQAVPPAGAGTAEDPYRITSPGELVWMGQGTQASIHFRLASDLDLSESASWPGGFPSIGTSSTGFGGTFDGAGFTLRNLTVRRGSTNEAGLFRRIAPTGFVRDLNLTGARISGSDSVGLLAGVNLGVVSNCTVQGVAFGRTGVGGLVGHNADPRSKGLNPSAQILQSAAFVQAWGVHNVGGLAGANIGSIERSFAAGTVEGAFDGSAVGGLVGANLHGIVLRSSASAVAAGNTRIGGLIGFFSGKTNGLVQESFATGPVTGRDATGGLIGSASPAARTESSFWNTAASGQSSSGGGSPLSPTAAQQTASFAGWDFSGTWSAPAQGLMPRPSWFPAAIRIDAIARGPGSTRTVPASPSHTPGSEVTLIAEPAGPGTEFVGWLGLGASSSGLPETSITADIDRAVVAVFRNVHDLAKRDDLRRIGQESGWELNDRYRLLADLDFTGASPLNPIGPDQSRGFTGVFEGNGRTIRGLTIGTSTNSASGLFGFVGPSARIVGLNITAAKIAGFATVGGIAARNAGLISGCSVEGQITGELEVGGIAGVNTGIVEDCLVTGNVSGRDDVGGIAGTHAIGQLRRIRFNGTIAARRFAHHVGGICGWMTSGALTEATISGRVTGSEHTGGAVGFLEDGRPTKLVATNLTVSGRYAVGGIAGTTRDSVFIEARVSDSTISGAASTGGLLGDSLRSSSQGHRLEVTLRGTNDVGGLVGTSQGGIWSEGDLTVAVNGKRRVGGVAGYSLGDSISTHRITGPIAGVWRVGGAAGDSDGILESIDVQSEVSGDSEVGGIAGYLASPSSLRGSTATGKVQGRESAGGLVGVNLGSIESSVSGANVTATELLAGGIAGLNFNGTLRATRALGSVSGASAAGGVVGQNHAGLITQSDASGAISGDDRTGGIAGENNAGRITRSTASGLVLGGIRAGGIAGENAAGGLIELSVSSAAVDAIAETGGLVGRNADPAYQSTIRQSVASGPVSGTGLRIGGLVGFNELPFANSNPWAVFTDSYHLAGQGLSDNPPAGVPLSREDLHRMASFAGWNFTSDWSISEGSSIPRPAGRPTNVTLRVIVDGPGTVEVSPSRTSYAPGEQVTITPVADSGSNRFRGWTGLESRAQGTRPVTITLDANRTVLATFQATHPVETIDDLARIGREPAFKPGDHYYLVQDIDASATRTWNDPQTSPELAEGFTPIGSESSPFTGSLDGAGHAIDQLAIRRLEDNPIGLIAVAGRGASIQNLGMTNASIIGKRMTGALIGNNWGGVLERIRVHGEVQGSDEIGLVAGLHQGALTDVVATGTVVPTISLVEGSGLGGIAGQASNSRIRHAHFSGTIQPGVMLPGIGGIAGHAEVSSIEEVSSSGTLAAVYQVGGILGSADTVTLRHAWSTANVRSILSDPFGTGGLVGYLFRSKLDESAFAGSITNASRAGGIAGSSVESWIADCLYSGRVETRGTVGGVVSQTDNSTLLRCLVDGVLAGNFRTGPIFASTFTTSTVDAAFWNPESVGPAATLDSWARTPAELRNPATFTGWDFNSVWAIDPGRNNGFPYLRGLPYPGIDVAPGAFQAGGTSLLEWVARNRSTWSAGSLASIPEPDLLTAFLLDAPPAAGLSSRLSLRLLTPGANSEGIQLRATLTLDDQPVAPTDRAQWIVEAASELAGPWREIEIPTPPTPGPDGLTSFSLQPDDGSFFRVRLAPAYLR